LPPVPIFLPPVVVCFLFDCGTIRTVYYTLGENITR
jgi:hypothetical protein